MGKGRTAGMVVSAWSGSCAPLKFGMAGSGLRSISSTDGVWPASLACFFRWNCSPAARVSCVDKVSQALYAGHNTTTIQAGLGQDLYAWLTERVLGHHGSALHCKPYISMSPSPSVAADTAQYPFGAPQHESHADSCMPWQAREATAGHC